jgi:putative spermidine/putrescine transport system substrate-binding protein
MATWHRLAAFAVALVLVGGACGGDDDDNGSSGSDGDKLGGEPLAAIGDGEGKVSVLAWPYYAEDGTFNQGLDWVTPFEEETGCDTSVKYFGTSDEAVQLFQTGQYDVVSASGDASLRLVYSGDAAALNTDLLENYDDLAPFLKEQQNNSVDGTVFGVPHGWGANLLQYNTTAVKPAPTSWGAVFDGDSPYSGKVTAYDSPIYIADAALYLMKTQPDLGIENPYALDEDQLAAAVDLLKEQKPIIGEYWSDYVKMEQAYTNGSLVMGTTWQVIANTLTGQKPPVPVDTVLPDEGSTAWSDNWMLHPDAKNPNCAYMWMNYITSPKAQEAVATNYGEAPANIKTCAEIADHCKQYGADDESFYSQLYYWTTPTKECLDGRDVECTDYNDWTQAWTEVKG